LLEDALNTLSQIVQPGPSTRLPLDQCFDRILAVDIISDMDFPPFDRSPLDGYAVRLADVQYATQQQPAFLEQVDYMPAGTDSRRKIKSGEAIRVMTGAKIPDGADAIIRLEDTSANGTRIAIMNAKQACENICFQGEEIHLGEPVLAKGSRLREGELSILAMLGYSNPLVYEQPKIAVLATGSELVPITAMLSSGKIRDTNSYMLLAKLRSAFCEPDPIG